MPDEERLECGRKRCLVVEERHMVTPARVREGHGDDVSGHMCVCVLMYIICTHISFLQHLSYIIIYFLPFSSVVCSITTCHTKIPISPARTSATNRLWTFPLSSLSHAIFSLHKFH